MKAAARQREASARILALAEAAEYLHTSYSTVHRLVTEGSLDAFRPSNSWRTSTRARSARRWRHDAHGVAVVYTSHTEQSSRGSAILVTSPDERGGSRRYGLAARKAVSRDDSDNSHRKQSTNARRPDCGRSLPCGRELNQPRNAKPRASVRDSSRDSLEPMGFTRKAGGTWNRR